MRSDLLAPLIFLSYIEGLHAGIPSSIRAPFRCDFRVLLNKCLFVQPVPGAPADPGALYGAIVSSFELQDVRPDLTGRASDPA